MFRWTVLGVAGICFLVICQASIAQARGWRRSCPNCQYSAPAVKVPATVAASAAEAAAQADPEKGKAAESLSDSSQNSQGGVTNSVDNPTYRRVSRRRFRLLGRFRR